MTVPSQGRLTPRLRADLTLLFVALIWGIAFIAQRIAVQYVGVFLFTSARFLIGGLVLLVICRGRQFDVRKNMPWILLSGSILAAGSAMQQAGLATTTAANAGFITGTYVVFVPLLLFTFWRQRSQWVIWMAALVTIVGIFLLSGAGALEIHSGDALELAGAVIWGFHVIIIGMAVQKVDVVVFSAGQFLVAGMLNLIPGLLFESTLVPGFTHAWLPVLYAGLISTAIGFTLQAVGQRNTPPADSAIILSMEAVFAALFGWILLGEELTLIQIIGCVLIFASILAVQLLPNNRKNNP
ncbi:MAG TPA: DMT family transporter [Longilinea sp.]|nr:DMT family transporter [Longilinea sp.]